MTTVAFVNKINNYCCIKEEKDNRVEEDNLIKKLIQNVQFRLSFNFHYRPE